MSQTLKFIGSGTVSLSDHCAIGCTRKRAAFLQALWQTYKTKTVINHFCVIQNSFHDVSCRHSNLSINHLSAEVCVCVCGEGPKHSSASM